jgi:hypothetical protein
MTRTLLAAVAGGMFLLAGSPALAKKDGDLGGKSSPKMSTQGQTNANSPLMGQDKGALRADDRKDDHGLKLDQDDKKPKKDNKGKSKGHDK